jgi:hypothetical protein
MKNHCAVIDDVSIVSLTVCFFHPFEKGHFMKQLLVCLVVLSLCAPLYAQGTEVQTHEGQRVANVPLTANDSVVNMDTMPALPWKVELLHQGPEGWYNAYNRVIHVMYHLKAYNSLFNQEFQDMLAYYPAAQELFNNTAIIVGDKRYFQSFNDGVATTTQISGSDYTTLLGSTSVSTYSTHHDYGRISSGSGWYGPYDTMKVTIGGSCYELRESWHYSPIVLDMDGDNKLEASKGNYRPHPYTGTKLIPFDLNGDNFDEMVEWVGPNDGLLLQYKAGEKVNGNHLFGNAGGWRHGFEKLATLDKDNDGMLKGEELATLSVWQDKNMNGLAEADEVKSVSELGITMIKTSHTEDLVSSFQHNGAEKKMWDWYPTAFKAEKKQK